MSRPIRMLALALLAVALGGCRSLLAPEVQTLFGGYAAGLQTGPVSVCRVEPQAAPPKAGPGCHGYARLNADTVLPDPARRAVVDVLLAAPAYAWEPSGRVRLCGFEPTFALATPELDILVSLVCDRLRVYAAGGDTPVSEQEFTPATHRALVLWLQQRFPRDTYVQLLQPE